MNFLYAQMVSGMDTKERDEFDATLNSGVSSPSWDRMTSAAFDRLAAGEFDRDEQTGDH
jgi:hypothetical protein